MSDKFIFAYLFFWPISIPATLAIIIFVLWWLFAGAKIKTPKEDIAKKDYSLIFIFGSIIVIAIVGLWIYYANKIPN